MKWAALPFQTVELPGGTVLLHPSRGGTVIETTARVARFLEFAQSLRTWEDHIARWGARGDEMRPAAGVADAHAEDWRGAGLLWNEADAEKAWKTLPADPGPPGPLAWAAIPTRNHPGPALRTARALLETSLKEDHPVSLLVADDSPDPSMRRTLAEGLADLSRSTGRPVFAAGPETRRAWIKALADTGAADPGLLEFAFSDPLGSGFACGANRNFILSLLVGERFVSSDDDILPDLLAARQPGSGCGVPGRRDPFHRWFGRSQEELAAQGRRVDAGFWKAHDRVLGRTPAGAADNPAFDWEGFNPDLLVEHAESLRVAASFPGLWGYPPVGFTSHLLALRGKDLEGLVRDPAFFHAVMRGGWQAAVAPRPSCADMSYFPGMCMGLDNARFLPPFLPVLHGEDAAYGIFLSTLMPGALAWHHPWAVLHDPGRSPELCHPSDPHPANRAPYYELHQVFRALWSQFPHVLTTRSPIINCERAGVWLEDLAALDPADWQHFWFDLAAGLKSQEINILRTRAAGTPERFRHYHETVETYLGSREQALLGPKGHLPAELWSLPEGKDGDKLLRGLLSGYGRLLRAWPSIREASLALARNGRRGAILEGRP